MRSFATIALLLLTGSAAQADRPLYTSELAERASLIAVWGRDDLSERSGDLRLKRPSLVLKGKAGQLDDVEEYSPRLARALEAIRERGPHVLFLSFYDKTADLVANEGSLQYDALTSKVIQDVLRQMELQRTWASLSIREQIERSDVIVSGEIADSGNRTPTSYWVSVSATYRGIAPQRVELLPVAVGRLNVPCLLLLQRYYGSGPDYMLMHSVPLSDAGSYLELLSKGTSQPRQ